MSTLDLADTLATEGAMIEDTIPFDGTEDEGEGEAEVEAAEALAEDGPEDGSEEADEATEESDATLAAEQGEGAVPEGDLFSRRAFALRLAEALLFASDKPVSEVELAKRLPEDSDVRGLLRQLAEDYAERGVQLVNVAGGWAFRTAGDLSTSLRSVAPLAPRKLSRAAVEALAIIAYHQPVTRAEVEQIRGVALSRGTLEILLEAGWIKPRGRRQTPGRPVTWGTSTDFLDHFGLARIEDLPGVEELKAAGLLERRATVTTIAMRAEDHQVEESEAEIADEDPLALAREEASDEEEGEGEKPQD